MSHQAGWERELSQKGFSLATISFFRKIAEVAQPGTISLDVTELEAMQHEFRLLRNQLDELRARIQENEINHGLPDEVLIENMRDVHLIDKTTGEAMTVNTEGRGDVVQHSHVDSTYVHFDTEFAAGAVTQDFIIIDLSDTTNYAHSNTGYIHIEELHLYAYGASSSTFTAQIGFLENVDGTDGDFYELMHLYGDKTSGQTYNFERKFYPNGPRCQSAYVTTSDNSANDTAFQTDVNLASTLDPSTADTPSGDGDIVMRIVSTTGDFAVELNLSYHTHA
jgi:hypothetical protein